MQSGRAEQLVFRSLPILETGEATLAIAHEVRLVILDLVTAAPTVFDQLAGLIIRPVIPEFRQWFLAAGESGLLTHKPGPLVPVDGVRFSAPFFSDLFDRTPLLVIPGCYRGNDFTGGSGWCFLSAQLLIKHFGNRTFQRQRRVGGHLSVCDDSKECNEGRLWWPADV